MNAKKKSYRTKTKFTGVYERTSDHKIFKGKPDVCFDICYKVEGRLVWEKTGWCSEGYSAKLAAQVRSERLRTIRHSEELPEKKRSISFKDLMTQYLDSIKDRTSYRDDESRYRNYLADRFDNKRLTDIQPLDLERLKNELSKKKLAPATIAHVLKLVRHVYNRAIAWGYFQGLNPFKQVKLPAVNNERQRFLNYKEADELLTALEKVSQQTHDVALLALHCGLRVGEIFNLINQDIDLQNNLLGISDPKNKIARSAYMTDAVKKMLLYYYNSAKPDEVVFKDKWHGERVRFISKTFTRVVDQLKLNEGITDRRQKIVFHSLRHTFASWLALQGESLITLRDLLGHKTTTMTNRYAHLVPDHKRAAVLKLEQSINEKNGQVTI